LTIFWPSTSLVLSARLLASKGLGLAVEGSNAGVDGAGEGEGAMGIDGAGGGLGAGAGVGVVCDLGVRNELTGGDIGRYARF
jgi:hypothetical protein